LIIALEGIDGSGKTAIAQLLCREFEKENSSTKNWSKASADFEESYVRAQMLKLRELIWCPTDEEPPNDLLGTHYYLFLMAAWFSVVQRCRLQQIQENNLIAIFDGWYYRTIVKAFIRQNLDTTWLRTLFATVCEPDFVVLLDIDPAVAWSRRPKFKPTEVGAWDGFTGDSFNTFCSYQQLVRQQLL
jgi:thymidylate kinase